MMLHESALRILVAFQPVIESNEPLSHDSLAAATSFRSR